ncbi:hypothetical protein Calag_0820 [Caldisphaera lagunensis DSM 15908]|uniref:Iron-sulfur cluster loop n=2 Tax=Caldisphaera lagunensis TaxID=200415 RepID=L0A9L3_CALLD|nr:hypothetical protein Calag_0820 [Caldisphaera lagunensis DSM 15908]
MQVKINQESCEKLGSQLKSLKMKNIDMYDDENYFPPLTESKENVFLYFLVMVSIDHRLRFHDKPFEGFIENKFYHGADALYKLGILKYKDDPSFFYPENLANINIDTVTKWLTIENKEGKKIYPSDIRVRHELLKDIGIKIKKNFSDPYDIITISKGYLRRDYGNGFIDILKIFKAYQDPVEKKAFLLAKFLERRSILSINDPYNKELPIDNHLTRIALRLGIVDVDDTTREKIYANIEFSDWEDILLRLSVRQAYKMVSQYSGIDPFILDDFLWAFGRSCCKTKDPVCKTSCTNECIKITGCKENCIFTKECKAFQNRIYMIPEHNFKNTWWY